MSDLKESVRGAIANYVSSKLETHTEADVLRVIRDQAMLLFERQSIIDMLDADPMEQLSSVRPEVNKIKNMLEVIACNRVVTHEGYSSIEATVQWKQDGTMSKQVKEYLQFYFKYERRPMRPEDIVAAQVDFGSDKESLKLAGNHIGYVIDVSKDHGERERLLTVEVWARGDGPSQGKPEPLLASADDWEDMDENDDMDEAGKSDDEAMEAQAEEILDDSLDGQVRKVDDEEKQSGKSQSDKFAAYIDPDILAKLINWSSLELDETEYFFLLMTFPFYEQEWDLVGFVLDVVFAEDDSYDDVNFDAVEFDKDDEAGAASESD